MLVDRILNSIFDSLESKRETGYRHPHCIMVIGAEKQEQEKKSMQRIV
jgi:hypothetical protein